MSAVVRFPAAAALHHVQAYDSVAPDGLAGGSPHLHLTCTEGYVVLTGRGMLQTLGSQGYQETALEPGVVAWFSPGVVHRLVNLGDLAIIVMMENRLPDAGDHVLTFAPDRLASDEAYAEAAVPGLVTPPDEGWIRRRRDLAVEGFGHWKARVDAHGPAALAELHVAAGRLVRRRIPAWQDLSRTDPAPAPAHPLELLRALGEGRGGHLAGATVRASSPETLSRFGLCGMLTPYASPEAPARLH